jgi:hypothetical protein
MLSHELGDVPRNHPLQAPAQSQSQDGSPGRLRKLQAKSAIAKIVQIPSSHFVINSDEAPPYSITQQPSLTCTALHNTKDIVT